MTMTIGKKIRLCNSCDTAYRKNNSSVLPILSNDNNIRQKKSQCVTHATQSTGIKAIPVSPMQQSKQKKPNSFVTNATQPTGKTITLCHATYSLNM